MRGLAHLQHLLAAEVPCNVANLCADHIAGLLLNVLVLKTGGRDQRIPVAMNKGGDQSEPERMMQHR